MKVVRGLVVPKLFCTNTQQQEEVSDYLMHDIYIYIYIPAYCIYIPPVIQIRVLTSLPTKQQKSKAAKQRNSKTAKQHNCKTLKQQISSSAAQQHSKTTKQQNSKSAKLQNSKSANQQLNSKTAKWQHSKTGTPEGGNLVSKHVL